MPYSKPSFAMLEAQRGVWYGTLLEPDSPRFNMSQTCEVLGPVDPAVLRAPFHHVSLEVGSMRELVDEESAYRASGEYDEDRRYWTERMDGAATPPSLSLGPRRGEDHQVVCSGNRFPEVTRPPIQAVAVFQAVAVLRSAARPSV